MQILFDESDFWKKDQDFTSDYKKTITDAYKACKKLLPQIPEELTFFNQIAPWDCMPEYGQGAYTKNSRLIIIASDSGLPYGKKRLLEYTKQAVFHELSHSARYEQGLWHETFIDSCIMEGLAVVMEREHAQATPLYGQYDQGVVHSWIQEINKAGNDINHYSYMFKHPDGRRWIGYKVGTYLIDEAMKRTGKKIEELTGLQCSEIIMLSGIKI